MFRVLREIFHQETVGHWLGNEQTFCTKIGGVISPSNTKSQIQKKLRQSRSFAARVEACRHVQKKKKKTVVGALASLDLLINFAYIKIALAS